MARAGSTIDVAAPFLDTDPIVRLVTRDDAAKAERSAVLFARIEAGELRAAAPSTVIHDAVFVLTSPRLFGLPRDRVRDDLATLVRIPGFEVGDRAIVLRALDVFATHRRLDFGDAMIVAAMELAGATVLHSHDRDFDHLPGITRQEP